MNNRSNIAQIFSIPTQEFRSLPIPNYDNAKIGTCFARVTDIPAELSEFMTVNPRVPKRTTKGVLSGPVPKAILETLRESPEEMALKNAGIYILAENAEHSREKGGGGIVTITLANKHEQGIVNGGHTFSAICEAVGSAEEEQLESLRNAFVRLHILQGIPHELVAEIAEGLNRSKQVQDPSLENLRGHFDEIKKVMKGRIGEDQIAYHEGGNGDIYIAEILSLIEIFNLERYPEGDHPHGLYAHQSRAVKEFSVDFVAEPSPVKLVITRLPEILSLADEIRKQAPILAKSIFEIGRMKQEGGKKRVASENVKLHFLGEMTKYRLPNGWLYPMLAAFRANVRWNLKKTQFEWRVPNEEVLKHCLQNLVSVCVNEHRNNNQKPEWVGKRDSAYRQCHLHVELFLAKRGKLD